MSVVDVEHHHLDNDVITTEEKDSSIQYVGRTEENTFTTEIVTKSNVYENTVMLYKVQREQE